jgi:hypothetical protein
MPRPALVALAVALAAAQPACAAAHAAGADPRGDVIAVHIVSRVGDAGAPDDRPKRARKDQPVTLYAAITVRRGEDTFVVADVSPIVVGGKQVATHAWTDAPPVTLAWNKIEPAVASMSNEASGTFAFEPIEYRATAIDGAAARTAIAADVRPTLTPDHGDGVGTMRYQLVVTAGDRTLATPGADARRGRGSGGLTDAVHRVSIRRDDTYLGFLTELYGQPYIWASAGTTDATHQAERLEGADCADFVVYGARRLGLAVPYTWTEELPRYTRTLARGAPDEHGVYRDGKGDAIAFPRVGDLILFPRHVGVVVADRGTPGVLDEDDVIMHALFDTPKEVRIADSGYGGLPIQVLRWPKAR